MARYVLILSLVLIANLANAITVINSTRFSFTHGYIVSSDSVVATNADGCIIAPNLLKHPIHPGKKKGISFQLDKAQRYDLILLDSSDWIDNKPTRCARYAVLYSIPGSSQSLEISDVDLVEPCNSSEQEKREYLDLRVTIKNAGNSRLVRMELGINQNTFLPLNNWYAWSSILPGREQTFVQPYFRLAHSSSRIYVKYWTEYNGLVESETSSYYLPSSGNTLITTVSGREITIEQPVKPSIITMDSQENRSPGDYDNYGELSMENQGAPDLNKVYEILDEYPQFIGGTEALAAYLYCKLNFKKLRYEEGKKSSAFVTFIVEEDGTISNVKLVKGTPYQDFNEKALEIISAMPKWKPGVYQGTFVKSRMYQKVCFDNSYKPSSCD